MTRQIVVVDVETTGLDPDRHIVVEVGWVNLATGVEGSFVPPHLPHEALAHADIHALQVNGYVDRLALSDQDAAGGAACALAEQLDGATLAGATPSFDAVFLRRMFRAYEDSELCWTPGWHHRLLDLSAYTAGVLAIHPGELPGLSTVCDRLGVTNTAPHTALGDARATAECFRRLNPVFTTDHTEGPQS